MTGCGMNASRSSSVRAAGQPSPFPVAAALPPTFHNAKLPRCEGGYNNPEVPFWAMEISASISCQMGAKGGSTLSKAKISAKLLPQFVLDHTKVASQSASLSEGTLRRRGENHPSERKAA